MPQRGKRMPVRPEHLTNVMLASGSVIHYAEREARRNSADHVFYKVPVTCGDCGARRTVQYSQLVVQIRRGLYTGWCKHCQMRHYVPKHLNGKDDPAWVGTTTTHPSGYRYTRISKHHPFACMAPPSQRNPKYGSVPVAQHRLVMAEHLGRPLETWEIVHHIDRNKQRNVIENLELVADATHHTQITHLQLRVQELEEEVARLNALIAAGHPQS